ncbi:MAG: asparagine synthase-related protein [Flavobacteriales bacterium]
MFDGFKIIQPGSFYDIAYDNIKPTLYYPNYIETNKEEFYHKLESYFRGYEGKTIGVHLSGGLDSSIIIGLLNHFDIPFYLVGLISDRFEFRTERTVQEKLARFGRDSVLINMDSYPAYSNLSMAPLTQLPDATFKGWAASKAVAATFASLGVQVVFTGQGGDTIFVDRIPNHEEKCSFNIDSEFYLHFDATVIYPEYQISLVSPFADKTFINSIYSLRQGENQDYLKKWARRFFADVLPRELVEYTYAADFFGTSMSGLDRAKPEIEKLFKIAHKVSGHALFAPASTKEFLAKDVFSFEYQDYIEYCDLLALAVWYNSLAREGYVQ